MSTIAFAPSTTTWCGAAATPPANQHAPLATKGIVALLFQGSYLLPCVEDLLQHSRIGQGSGPIHLLVVPCGCWQQRQQATSMSTRLQHRRYHNNTNTKEEELATNYNKP